MKKAEKGWRRLIRLANADPSDDPALAATQWSLLRAFVPDSLQLDGVPRLEMHLSFVPSLAREARSVQPSLRILLRWVARDQTAQDSLALQIMAKSRSCELKRVSEHPDLRGKTPIPLSEFETFQSEKDKRENKIGLRAKRAKDNATRKKFGEWYQVPDYRTLLDLVCGFIREALDQQPEREPIRLCKLPSCGKFFMRCRRKLFCCKKHKTKFNSPHRKPVSAEVRRDRQYKWLQKKLLKDKGVEAVKARIEQVKWRKIPPEKRSRLLRILRAVLRRQQQASGGRGVHTVSIAGALYARSGSKRDVAACPS